MKPVMVPPSLFFLLAVSFSVINLDHVQSRKLWDVSPSPTVCSPCQQIAPPTPPPPSQLPQPIYGVPPPPAPVFENPYTPPSPRVNCSQVPPAGYHPPPYPLGYQPPYPYGYQPPPFVYQPVPFVENYSSCFSPSYLVSAVLSLVSIVLLF